MKYLINSTVIWYLIIFQIPPPKPPPPEMHFIPNPSNTEFIYLLGLEHVVDYITKDQKTPSPPEPFQCSQCNTSFTPIWKWEKNAAKGNGNSFFLITFTLVYYEYCILFFISTFLTCGATLAN